MLHYLLVPDGSFTLSVFVELELFSQELHRYMSPHALEHLVREVGFVQRRGEYRTQDLAALQ